jgi:hypothetical protein
MDERKIHVAKKMQSGNNNLKAHSLFCFRKTSLGTWATHAGGMGKHLD